MANAALTETLFYKGSCIQFVTDIQKKKPVYWIVIDNRTITFVSKLETAKRIACNFIDVVDGEEFMTTKHGGCIASGFFGRA